MKRIEVATRDSKELLATVYTGTEYGIEISIGRCGTPDERRPTVAITLDELDKLHREAHEALK